MLQTQFHSCFCVSDVNMCLLGFSSAFCSCHLQVNLNVLFFFSRFIATGETYKSLSFAYRISDSYISTIIRKVLRLLREKLLPIAMPSPTTEDFKRIEKLMWEKWNIPNCVSSIDGKHVRIKAPPHSGSLFFNYKDYFSIFF